MQPSPDLIAHLRAQGFERILEVPAVPEDNPHQIRLGLTVPVEASGRTHAWSVRSFTTDFNIIVRGWLRQGMLRCYSLGWGHAGDGQTDQLLLAQAYLPTVPAAVALSGELTSRLVATRVRWVVDGMRGHACLRLAAQLRPGTGYE